MLRTALACLVALIVTTAVPAPASAQSAPASCSTAGKNLYVRDVMSDLYLWYREIPNVNPTSYASPEAYLEAVRYRTLDSTFSYITSRAANDAFYSDSEFIGFGLSTTLTDLEMRVTQVFPESPASEAGLSRGDRLVEIGGRLVTALISTNQIGSAFGASEIGVELDIAFVDQTGTRHEAHMIKRLVTIPTVSLTRSTTWVAAGSATCSSVISWSRRTRRSTTPSPSSRPRASTSSYSIFATTAAGS